MAPAPNARVQAVVETPDVKTEQTGMLLGRRVSDKVALCQLRGGVPVSTGHRPAVIGNTSIGSDWLLLLESSIGVTEFAFAIS